MLCEACRRCGEPFRFNLAIQLGTRATDYDSCHAFCDACRIGISNSRDPKRRTYICQFLADNLAAPESEQRYLHVMEHALNQRNRENKIRRARFEKSEDTLVWSTFSHLEERDLLAVAAQVLAGVGWSDLVEVLYWGYNDRRSAMLHDQLVSVLSDLGESARSFSEPDLILYTPQTGLLFVEAKYASTNSTNFDYAKAQRYLTQGGVHLKSNCGNLRHYELLRNWVIGCLLAKKLNLPFRLVNLVRRGDEIHIESAFGEFLLQEEGHQFRRAEWEGLFEALCPVANQLADEQLWSYVRTRTIYFQPAFPWVWKEQLDANHAKYSERTLCARTDTTV